MKKITIWAMMALFVTAFAAIAAPIRVIDNASAASGMATITAADSCDNGTSMQSFAAQATANDGIMKINFVATMSADGTLVNWTTAGQNQIAADDIVNALLRIDTNRKIPTFQKTSADPVIDFNIYLTEAAAETTAPFDEQIDVTDDGFTDHIKSTDAAEVTPIFDATSMKTAATT